MSTQQHHHHEDQTALALRLRRLWDDFRQGKVVGYKLMAVLLILIAVIGCIWYIWVERIKANSMLWVSFQEANSISSLEELASKNPNTIVDRLSRLQVARYQLGVAGIDQLGVLNPEQRQKAVENIEKAREALKTLLPEFKDDPVFKAECLLGLARAEAALVGVPAKEGQLTEFKGSVPKVVEYLDQLSEAAAKDTPWQVKSKNLADTLRNENAATEHEFVRVERELFKPLLGNLGGPEPQMPGAPPFPGGIGGIPGIKPPEIPGVPVAPPPPKPTPPGPIIEPAPNPNSKQPAGTTPPTPPATPAKTPDAKTPDNSIPPPIAPGPKPPEAKTPPANLPKAPEAKAPVPPTPPK